MTTHRTLGLLATFSAGCLLSVSCSSQEYLPGLKWREPPVVTPGESDSDPPSDAVVLFGGKNLAAFEDAGGWKVRDGEMISGKGSLVSRQDFGDCQVHLEWSAPVPPRGNGQQRGNSGLFFNLGDGRSGYELQVLDSFNNKTYFDGQAGAIYKQMPPMVNAIRPPGEWNAYDVIWTAPRFNEDGTLKSPAYITALHNGVLIQNHFAVQGNTFYHAPASYTAHPVKGQIGLQDHGNPVRFRNFWVRDFQIPQSERVREPHVRIDGKEVPYKG
jgi:hypothetical protein